MDEYFHSDKAIPYLEKEKKEMPNSTTVVVINGIAKAQLVMSNNFSLVQDQVASTVHNENLDGDLRKEALDIILNYMNLYQKDDIQERISLDYKTTEEGILLSWIPNDETEPAEGYVLFRTDSLEQKDFEPVSEFISHDHS